MSAFPRKNLVFVVGLAAGVAGLAAFAILDADSLAFDRALAELSAARRRQEQELEAVRRRMLDAIASGGESASREAVVVFSLHLGLTRRSDDIRSEAAVQRLCELDRIGAARIIRRLQDVKDPQWLFLFDLLGTGLAPNTRTAYVQAFHTFLDNALAGDDWPLRVRVAIHRPNHGDATLLRDLGLPDPRAASHLIEMLASPDLFDRIEAAAALETVMNRPVKVEEKAGAPAWMAAAADRSAWQAEAERWRAFWKVNGRRPRIEWIVETLQGATKKQRLNACRLIEDVGGPEAIKALMEVLGDEDREVQTRAVGALARLGHGAAVRILLDFAFEDRRLGAPVDVPAMEEIETLGTEAAGEIIEQILSSRARSRPVYRRALAMVLRDMRVERAASVFRKMATGKDAADRIVGLDALSDLEDRSDETLRKFVESLRSADPRLRLSAARGLARLVVLEQAVPVLMELLEAPGENHVIPLSALALLTEALPNGPRLEPGSLPADPAAARGEWRKYWQKNRRRILSLPPDKAGVSSQ